MAETLGAGGDRAEGTREQSTRSHRQAGAPSRDLSIATHLDGWLRRERPESSTAAAKATQLPGLEREEKEEGDASNGRVGLTEPPGRVRPGRPAPTGGLGPTGGTREIFNQQTKQKITIKNKGFLKNLLTPNKEQKNNHNFAKIILNKF
jgi:hypothetical protein